MYQIFSMMYLGFQRIIWTMRRQIGVPITRGLVISKFLNNVPNFLKDIPMVLKFVSKQGTTSNYFLKIPKEIKRTTGNNIEVLVAHGLDVQNCFKDVPNFMKYIPNFINDIPNCFQDVPWVPMSVLGWGITSNSFSRVPKGIYEP